MIVERRPDTKEGGTERETIDFDSEEFAIGSVLNFEPIDSSSLRNHPWIVQREIMKVRFG